MIPDVGETLFLNNPHVSPIPKTEQAMRVSRDLPKAVSWAMLVSVGHSG